MVLKDSVSGLARGACYSEEVLDKMTDECERSYPVNYQDEKVLKEWIRQCIVDYYCFKQRTSGTAGIEWEEQPTFVGLIGTPHFNLAADFAKIFFLKNNNWQETIRKWESTDTEYLLFITAVRYILVISSLYDKSKPRDAGGNQIANAIGRFETCETEPAGIKNEEGKPLFNVKIPSYSCYPAPYGSATPTSDFDLGLIGPKSGELLANFNTWFLKEFNEKSSEEVCDSNIYSYTMEYTMPQRITGMFLVFFSLFLFLFLFVFTFIIFS